MFDTGLSGFRRFGGLWVQQAVGYSLQNIGGYNIKYLGSGGPRFHLVSLNSFHRDIPCSQSLDDHAACESQTVGTLLLAFSVCNSNYKL